MPERHTSETDTRFYGRRLGRRLRPAQKQILEAFGPVYFVDVPEAAADPAACLETWFLEVGPPYCLEIGFGSGEHLVYQAQTRPEVAFLGCEAYCNGLVQVLRQLQAPLQDGSQSNVKIFPDDARKLLPHLPQGAFAEIYLMFPDPWPKTRHASRRFIQTDRVGQLADLLTPGGVLRVASDDPTYIQHSLPILQACPALEWTAQSKTDWHQPFSPECVTRYQQKALQAGRQPVFLKYRKLS